MQLAQFDPQQRLPSGLVVRNGEQVEHILFTLSWKYATGHLLTQLLSSKKRSETQLVQSVADVKQVAHEGSHFTQYPLLFKKYPSKQLVQAFSDGEEHVLQLASHDKQVCILPE